MKKLLQLVLASIFFIAVFGVNNSSAQLSGNYTVGGGGDFTTLSAAILSLNTNGVNGPVIFDIMPGNYNQSTTINQITGASAVNNIVFRSQTGVASSTNIFTTSADLFTIRLNGADHIAFQNLRFTDNRTATTNKRALDLTGNCDNIKVTGCLFRTEFVFTGIYSLGALTTNLYVDGNEFDLYRGIFMQEPTLKSLNTKIINNLFRCTYSISIFNHDDLLKKEIMPELNSFREFLHSAFIVFILPAVTEI